MQATMRARLLPAPVPQPQAAPRSVQLYADLADALWHAAGDVATDLSW